MDFAQNVVDRRMFTRAVQFFVFAAAITIVATIVTYIINPDLKTAVEGLKKSTSSEIHPATGLDKIWSYFRHNGLAVPFKCLFWRYPHSFPVFAQCRFNECLAGCSVWHRFASGSGLGG